MNAIRHKTGVRERENYEKYARHEIDWDIIVRNEERKCARIFVWDAQIKQNKFLPFSLAFIRLFVCMHMCVFVNYYSNRYLHLKREMKMILFR